MSASSTGRGQLCRSLATEILTFSSLTAFHQQLSAIDDALQLPEAVVRSSTLITKVEEEAATRNLPGTFD